MTMPPLRFSSQPSSGASPSSPSSSFSSGDGGDSVDLARPAEEGADLAVYTIGSGGIEVLGKLLRTARVLPSSGTDYYLSQIVGCFLGLYPRAFYDSRMLPLDLWWENVG